MTRESLVSRNIVVLNKRTSIRLEEEMWAALKEIAHYEGCTVNQICSLIALQKTPELSLTAATRVFVMMYYKRAMTEEGRERFHGNLRKDIIETNDNFNAAFCEGP